jgi:hypothetical protein
VIAALRITSPNKMLGCPVSIKYSSAKSKQTQERGHPYAGIKAAIDAKSPTPRRTSGLYQLVMDRLRDGLFVDLLLVGGRLLPSGDGQSRGSERRYQQRDQNGLKHGDNSSIGVHIDVQGAHSDRQVQ